MWLKAGTVVAGLALALTGCGASGTSAQSGPPPAVATSAAHAPAHAPAATKAAAPKPAAVTTNMKIGAAVTQTGTNGNTQDGHYTWQVQLVSATSSTAHDGLDQAATHGRFLVASMLFYDVTGVSVDTNSMYFKFRAADGTVYDPELGGSGNAFGQDLADDSLQPGVRARGVVVFDAPAVAGTIEFTPFGESPISWQIPA